MAFIAERVAPHKRIRRLEFIDQIPKSASGKILRRLLVEKERAQVAGQIDTAASQLVSSFLLCLGRPGSKKLFVDQDVVSLVFVALE